MEESQSQTDAEPPIQEFITSKHKHTVGQDPDLLEEILLKNRRIADDFVLQKCEREAARNWDIFYKNHQDRFFKNKNWTDREFKELAASKENVSTKVASEPMLEEEIVEGSEAVLLEVGCGPGNTLYPIVLRNSRIKVHCCDFSPRAVELVQSNPLYDQQRINPFVFDIVKNDPDLPVMLSQHSFGAPSIVSLIFVLSAIPPQHHRDIFAMLTRALPIGGTLCFRDFAHGDLCQVRFHQKASAAWCEPSLLSEKQDYYRRGDGTFAYFFNVEEIRSHAESVGLQGEVVIKEIHGENRKTGVQLHRRFVQGRWNKVR